MITQASTTFPWRRSFSVQVEMYSRGSKSRGRRSSRTACWRRMGPGSNTGTGKNLWGRSPAIADGGQADHRADRDEDESEESHPPFDVGCECDSAAECQGCGKVHEEFVEDEQDEA